MCGRKVLLGPARRAILAAAPRLFSTSLSARSQLRAGMAAADADDATLREFIAVLDAHRKECERECKYVEADIAKRRLAELRALAESREVDTVASRQHAQRQGVEEAQMLEFQQFNTLWDQKFREYDERAAELLDAMRQRHLLDQDEFRKGVEAGPAHRPKASKELLDLRRQLAQLVVAAHAQIREVTQLPNPLRQLAQLIAAHF